MRKSPNLRRYVQRNSGGVSEKLMPAEKSVYRMILLKGCGNETVGRPYKGKKNVSERSFLHLMGLKYNYSNKTYSEKKIEEFRSHYGPPLTADNGGWVDLWIKCIWRQLVQVKIEKKGEIQPWVSWTACMKSRK